MKAKQIFILLLAALSVLPLWAGGEQETAGPDPEADNTVTNQGMEDGSGMGGMGGQGKLVKRVVNNGEIVILEGILTCHEENWFVISGNDEYRIYIAPESYMNQIGLKLEENADIKVEGFIYEYEIVPVNIYFDDTEYMLFLENGTPPWGGGVPSGGGDG
jgi:hypothetical protein